MTPSFCDVLVMWPWPRDPIILWCSRDVILAIWPPSSCDILVMWPWPYDPIILWCPREVTSTQHMTSTRHTLHYPSLYTPVHLLSQLSLTTSRYRSMTTETSPITSLYPGVTSYLLVRPHNSWVGRLNTSHSSTELTDYRLPITSVSGHLFPSIPLPYPAVIYPFLQPHHIWSFLSSHHQKSRSVGPFIFFTSLHYQGMWLPTVPLPLHYIRLRVISTSPSQPILLPQPPVKERYHLFSI